MPLIDRLRLGARNKALATISPSGDKVSWTNRTQKQVRGLIKTPHIHLLLRVPCITEGGDVVWMDFPMTKTQFQAQGTWELDQATGRYHKTILSDREEGRFDVFYEVVDMVRRYGGGGTYEQLTCIVTPTLGDLSTYRMVVLLNRHQDPVEGGLR